LHYFLNGVCCLYCWFIVIGSFLIINGLPGGHQWYKGTFVHIAWNNLVSITSLPPEFHVGQHMHENIYGYEIPKDYVPIILFGLIAIPVVWYVINKKKEVII